MDMLPLRQVAHYVLILPTPWQVINTTA